MSDISTQTSDPASLHHEEEHGRARTPVGVRATCIVFVIATVVFAFLAYQRNAVVADVKAQLAQSKSESAQLKADGDKANALSSDLQSQLDTAKSRQSDLQSQLAKAQGERSDLQSQLTKVQGDRSALQPQLDSAKAQAAGFQTELAQANDRASGLGRELDQAKAQATDLQSQLAKANSEVARLQPLALKARAMPIATQFTKSFWGGGFTMHVTNFNPDPLKVNIEVIGSGKRAPMTATIQSGATFDVKGLAAGANVAITGDGYNNVNAIVR